MRRWLAPACALAIVAAACGQSHAALRTRAATPSVPLSPQVSPQPVGTSDWMLDRPGTSTQGYASRTSAAAGDTVSFYVSSTAKSFWADFYRMGWYGGKGAIKVLSLAPMLGERQPGPTPKGPRTGLTIGPWHQSFQLTIPASWPSGMYMAKLTDSFGSESYVPLVVRGRGLAPVLFVHSSATDAAYNLWGGNSLYDGRTALLNIDRAAWVSFDRPFSQEFGAGDFFFWEYQMVRFLERNGIAADYVTDVDVHEHPEWLLGYRSVLVVGHDEYWSRPMRDAYMSALHSGVSLAFFAGNTAYRQIRFLPSAVGPDRIVVCYKDPALDPEPNPGLKTAAAWRSPPTNWPESELLGVQYVGTGNIRPLPWIVSNPSSWVFAGTGLKRGSALPGLLGYEQDELGPVRPPGVSVLTDSPVATLAGGLVHSNAVAYRAVSGAWVFDTGSIQWSWGLDDFRSPETKFGFRPLFVSDKRPDYSSAVAKIIALNVLRKMLGDRFPTGSVQWPYPLPDTGGAVAPVAPTPLPPISGDED